MNVLWITNIEFPEALAILHHKKEHKSSGGWILGAANALIQNSNIKMYVATVSRQVLNLKVLQGEKITYYLIPFGKGNEEYNKEYEQYWLKIKECVHPDIVHIHGTEFTHGLSYVKVCGNEHVVVSIQGLVSACASYYSSGLSTLDILKNITLRDTLKSDKHQYKKRGVLENTLLLSVQYVIGRTSWDQARTWAINPALHYHICNETLRKEFYSGIWNYSTCIPHTIFLSQVTYPFKGFHQFIKALPLVVREYPDVQVKIAGANPTTYSSWRQFLHFTGYGKYLKHELTKSGLLDRIVFLGNLNAEDMKQEYLKANIFVCPSSIENSSNSLGEAQLLGVPCIASYVGGLPDMMHGNEENLYRFEEVEMLAEKICRVFRNKDKQVNMSQIARQRHDPALNTKQLISIYNEIIKD